MNALAFKRHKLRDALRMYPQLLDELKREREQGVSYSRLALIVYERTGLSVDPSTVRDWMIDLENEQN